jgi:hypothetical protein
LSSARFSDCLYGLVIPHFTLYIRNKADSDWKNNQNPWYNHFLLVRPQGQRITKKVEKIVAGVRTSEIEFHLRDASGNVMANYQLHPDSCALYLTEQPIMGKDGLGDIYVQSLFDEHFQNGSPMATFVIFNRKRWQFEYLG